MNTSDPYMTLDDDRGLEEEPAVIAGEEPTQMTDQERAELIGYGLIFNQLLQSDRFKTFFLCNFDLVKVVDDGEKTIDMHVVEVPPQLVPERMKKLIAEAQKSAPMVEVVGADALRGLKQ